MDLLERCLYNQIFHMSTDDSAGKLGTIDSIMLHDTEAANITVDITHNSWYHTVDIGNEECNTRIPLQYQKSSTRYIIVVLTK